MQRHEKEREREHRSSRFIALSSRGFPRVSNSSKDSRIRPRRHSRPGPYPDSSSYIPLYPTAARLLLSSSAGASARFHVDIDFLAESIGETDTPAPRRISSATKPLNLLKSTSYLTDLPPLVLGTGRSVGRCGSSTRSCGYRPPLLFLVSLYAEFYSISESPLGRPPTLARFLFFSRLTILRIVTHSAKIPTSHHQYLADFSQIFRENFRMPMSIERYDGLSTGFDTRPRTFDARKIV